MDISQSPDILEAKVPHADNKEDESSGTNHDSSDYSVPSDSSRETYVFMEGNVYSSFEEFLDAELREVNSTIANRSRNQETNGINGQPNNGFAPPNGNFSSMGSEEPPSVNYPYHRSQNVPQPSFINVPISAEAINAEVQNILSSPRAFNRFLSFLVDSNFVCQTFGGHFSFDVSGQNSSLRHTFQPNPRLQTTVTTSQLQNRDSFNLPAGQQFFNINVEATDAKYNSQNFQQEPNPNFPDARMEMRSGRRQNIQENQQEAYSPMRGNGSQILERSRILNNTCDEQERYKPKEERTSNYSNSSSSMSATGTLFAQSHFESPALGAPNPSTGWQSQAFDDSRSLINNIINNNDGGIQPPNKSRTFIINLNIPRPERPKRPMNLYNLFWISE